MTVASLKPPTDYNCPPWCESPDHSPGELEANDGKALHFGPEFGAVSIQQQTGEEFGVMFAHGDATIVLSTDELASLIRNGAQAQEWMEAHQ